MDTNDEEIHIFYVFLSLMCRFYMHKVTHYSKDLFGIFKSTYPRLFIVVKRNLGRQNILTNQQRMHTNLNVKAFLNVCP